MKEKTMNEWLMLLKTVPDNVFIEFFSDNPEMRYVAEDYDVKPQPDLREFFKGIDSIFISDCPISDETLKRVSKEINIDTGGISTVSVPQEPFKNCAIRDSAHPRFTIKVDEDGATTYFEDDIEVEPLYFLNHYGY